MEGSVFENIHECARYLNLDLGDQEMAILAEEKQMSASDLKSISDTLEYLKKKK